MHDYFTKRLPYPTEEQAERFWSKVAISGVDECWPWLASLNKFGYGQFGLDGVRRSVRAPRMAFLLWWGADPFPCDILHSCDNRACCNPYHFALGARRDNNADRHAKGRTARGTDLPQAKRTVEQVIDIRLRAARGEPHVSIAKLYACTTGSISYIVSRKHWAHVP